MQGRHILLLILLAATVLACGCTAPEAITDLQQGSSGSSPLLTLMQSVLTGIPAPTPAAPVKANATQEVRKVGFVDPAVYRIPTPTPTIAIGKQPDDLRVSERMVDYARATADYPPAVLATESYHIPFPYWAFNVSMTPMNDHPWLTIDIHDKDDPNRIVIKTIRYSRNDFSYEEGKPTERKERFTILEGYRDYYFVIRSESLKSFELAILVPEKYLI
ncbi:hypothetical protein DSECCO2_578450 [anaerobic digester metagenome]